MKLSPIYLCFAISACSSLQQAPQDQTSSKSYTLYPPSSFFHDAYYQPQLDSYGINMLPEGVDLQLNKQQAVLSRFEVTTDPFSGHLVRLTTSSQQVNEEFILGENWELNGMLKGKETYDHVGEKGGIFSTDSTDFEEETKTFLLPNIDQLIFNYQVVNLKQGEVYNPDATIYLDHIHIETANITHRTLKNIKWSLDVRKSDCPQEFDFTNKPIKLSYDASNKVLYKTVSFDPLIKAEFAIADIQYKNHPYPSDIFATVNQTIQLDDCSLTIRAMSESNWNFNAEKWQTLYEIYPDDSNTFDQLGIKLPELKQ